VDLVVLVSCFAILAVLAVPRHLSLSSESRRDEVQALASSVASAARLANALWDSTGRPVTMALRGGDVVLVNGFPSAGTIAQSLEPAEAMAFRFEAGRWQHREVASVRPCGVRYQPPATGAGSPSIRAETSGC
jgi:type II secretory pathway pseudopilin PulG